MAIEKTVPVFPVNREISRTVPGLTGFRRFEAVVPKWKNVRAELAGGLATWYGLVRNGHRTANGETFDCEKMTAASNVLPFGTKVRVTNLRNGKSVVVRVNDRGVLAPGHVIDLSAAAADRIGLLKMGIAPVHLDVMPKAS